LDARDELVGGLIYQPESSGIVNLRGIVVRKELTGRGLNSMLLEEFCRRMEDQGVRVIRTFFFAQRFYARHGFHVDPRWGGLVREIGSDAASTSS
jgi:GNAT superfamily N-acetyltransferase